MIRPPPRSTLTDTLFPYTRSSDLAEMVGAIEIAALWRGLGKHDAVLPGGPAFQYGFKLRLAPPDDDHVACTACHVQHVDVDAAHSLAQPIDRMCRVIVRSDQQIGRASCRERVCQYV